MTSRLEGLGIGHYSRSTGEHARRSNPPWPYVHASQTAPLEYAKLLGVTPQNLASTLEGFLSGSSGALVREDGAVLFDLTEAKYSISGESNKCLIHFWSEERNLVRRVLDIESKGETLRVTVQKMGQSKPVRLEICRERDPRSASAKKSARAAYQRILERVLKKKFPDLSLMKLSHSVDLEHSFGPIYVRGLLKRGQSAFAVLGVNSQELQSSVDAALTFGILWLDACRAANAGRLVVEGLTLFVPPGSSALVRDRITHLNPEIAKWRRYEVDERSDELKQIEIDDHGNVKTRLVRCADDENVLRRFGGPIARVRSLMAEAESAHSLRQRFRFDATGSSLHVHGCLPNPEIFIARRSWCSVQARHSVCSMTATLRISNAWRGASARCDMQMGRVNADGGGCIRSDGWNRW